MATAFAAGCQLLEIGDKIHQATDADNDETIMLSAPDTAAEGALFAVRAIDSCTESTYRCETDRIEVIDAHFEGPFVIDSFDADQAIVRATGSGDGMIRVEVEMDGEDATASIELSAAPITGVTFEPRCWDDPSPWIAPGAVLRIDYRLYGEQGELRGNIQPPLDTSLEFIDVEESQRAVYRAPTELGPVRVAWTTDSPSNIIQLEVFGHDMASLDVGERALNGPTAFLRLRENIDGVRPCVESDHPAIVRTETPSICSLLEAGEEREEIASSVRDAFQLSIHRAGVCTLTVGYEGESARTTLDVDVALP